MRSRYRLALAASAALAAACDPSAPEEERCGVPVAYASIADGLADAACPTLFVSPGTYTELVTISRDVTIVGDGAELVILDGGAEGTVVTVGAGATATLRGLTIRNGQAAAGGGIVNDGTLTLDEVTVSDNVAMAESPSGGGILNRGMLALTASVVARNHLSIPADHDAHLTELHGAGISSDGGMLRLDRGSRVEANEIALTGWLEIRGGGGGIFAMDASVVITGGSAIRDNTIDIESCLEGASAGGAGLSVVGGSLTLDGGSAIEGNVATTRSGGSTEGNSRSSGAGFTASVASVHLDAAFVRNNRAVARSAHGSDARGGGGYVYISSLLVSRTEITGNTARAEGTGNGTAVAEGGGLDLFTGARISDSRLSSNIVTAETESAPAVCRASAGALEAMPYMSESIVLERCTLDGNMVVSSDGYAEAGALEVQPLIFSAQVATVDVVQTTLSNNLVSGLLSAQGGAASGRGIDNSMVSLRFVNSTISGNRVDSPAGTASAGAVMGVTSSGATKANVHLASTTITGNSATGMIARSGGLFVQQNSAASPVTCTLRNSIIAGNTAATDPDCGSTGAAITSGGYNLLGAFGGCMLGGDLTGNLTGEARLGPLGDNGGPTRTHALMMGSPAIDAGNPAGCSDVAGALLAVDQRGQPRAVGGRCDIGAFEK